MLGELNRSLSLGLTMKQCTSLEEMREANIYCLSVEFTCKILTTIITTIVCYAKRYIFSGTFALKKNKVQMVSIPVETIWIQTVMLRGNVISRDDARSRIFYRGKKKTFTKNPHIFYEE